MPELLRRLVKDEDPEVRAQVIRSAQVGIEREDSDLDEFLAVQLEMVRAPLAEPVAPSTKNNKPIKVGEAYDREFERYLARLFIEQSPNNHGIVASLLEKANYSVETRLLASLALDPKTSAAHVAKLLPQLGRSPGQEEILRLAQFPDEPGVGDALHAILTDPKTGAQSLETLLAAKTRFDSSKLAPFLTGVAKTFLEKKDAGSIELATRLAGAFQLRGLEDALAAVVSAGLSEHHDWIKGEPAHQTWIGVSTSARQALRALRDIGSTKTDLFEQIVRFAQNPEVREEALATLAGSKAADAPARIFAFYGNLTPPQRRIALDGLSATKAGASAIVAALSSGKMATADLDGSTLDRLQAVLGSKDAALNKLVDSLGSLFRPVLMLDGNENAWTEIKRSFDGPLTVETWVRLTPRDRKIGNVDGILGAPGQIDINFFDGKLRVYAFPPLGDVVVAKKPMTPDVWTHVAAVRNAEGRWSLYIDGEPDSVGAKAAPGPLKDLRVAWTAAKGGTQGAFAEYRLWNRARTPEEIRRDFDRGIAAPKPDGLVFYNPGGGDWGTLQNGAHVGKTSDLPPLLTADEAVALDAKFAKYRALANQPGDVARGKQVTALCMACHLINGQGGNIGPNISGAGAMGQEALLRRLITPNASMESAYHVFRVNLRDGGIREGFLVREDKDAVVLRLPGTEDQRIPRSEVLDSKFLRRGMMPEGLLDTMTPQQVSDLFAYLMTLK
jgi:putative heme-binding domain-containing protein